MFRIVDLQRGGAKTLIIEQADREDVSLRMCGQVQSKMNHEYLVNWNGAPSINTFQLKMALSILQASHCSKKETELITTVILLIFHGLSIHEHINENQLDEKFRQLSVLAGDYYSSKYYYLLALCGKIDLIGLFAQAITRINEAKAEKAILTKDSSKREINMDLERYIALNEKIHGELLYVLCSKYLQGQSEIVNLVKSLIRTHIWEQEYNQFAEGSYMDNLSHQFVKKYATEDELRIISLNKSSIKDSKIMAIHVKYGTSGFLFEHLENELAAVKSMLSLIQPNSVRSDFNSVFNDLNRNYLQTERIVKER